MTKDRWTRWRSLTRDQRRATLAAAALIPLVAVSIKRHGLSATLQRVLRRPLGDPGDAPAAAQASELARAVLRASRYGVYEGNCLSRSVTLLSLLRGRGIVGELRFGARTGNGDLEAHAWVVHEGVPLTDPGDYGTLTPPKK